MNRCTVLGGQGFIGRHLTRYLRGLGYEVWVPDREALDDYLKMPETTLGEVFYCIGLTADFRARPFDTVRAHVSLLADVLERARFDSLLYLSSTRVYAQAASTAVDESLVVNAQNPSDLYNLSKLMGESLCASVARDSVRIARLSNVLGPEMGTDCFVGQLLKQAHDGHITLLSHRESVKDYILVDDVVSLLARIARSGKMRTYNVASGANISHAWWLDQLQSLTGCTLQVDDSAERHWFAPIDIGRVIDEFGFKPRSVQENLPELLAHSVL